MAGGPLTEDPSTKRVTIAMVGFFIAEATIMIKHFRRGAHSNGNTRFGQSLLTAKKLLQTTATLHLGEGNKSYKNST